MRQLSAWGSVFASVGSLAGTPAHPRQPGRRAGESTRDFADANTLPPGGSLPHGQPARTPGPTHDVRGNGSVDFVHVRHEEYGAFAAVAGACLAAQLVPAPARNDSGAVTKRSAKGGVAAEIVRRGHEAGWSA